MRTSKHGHGRSKAPRGLVIEGLGGPDTIAQGPDARIAEAPPAREARDPKGRSGGEPGPREGEARPQGASWAETWEHPEALPRMSAAWPLVWFAVLLLGCVLWGLLDL